MVNYKFDKDIIDLIKTLCKDDDNLEIANKLIEIYPSLKGIERFIVEDRVRYHTRKFKKYATKPSLSELVGKDHISKTVILTVSERFLIEKGLWNNTVCLSGLQRNNDDLHYDGYVRMGPNVGFRDHIDLHSVTNNCLLIVSSIVDWMESGTFPEDVLPISLTDNHSQDDLVLLMIAGTHLHSESKSQQALDN